MIIFTGICIVVGTGLGLLSSISVNIDKPLWYQLLWTLGAYAIVVTILLFIKFVLETGMGVSLP